MSNSTPVFFPRGCCCAGYSCYFWASRRLTAHGSQLALSPLFSLGQTEILCPVPDVRFSHPAVTRRSTTRHPCHLLLSGSGKHREVACSADRLHSGSRGLRSCQEKDSCSLEWWVQAPEYRSHRFFRLLYLNFFRFIPTSAVTFALFAVIANWASSEILQTAFYTDFRSHNICYDLGFLFVCFV